MSTAVTYLRPALRRPNLKVIMHARVTRVRFEGTRAVGVEYLQDRRVGRASARREVILSSGTYHSPQLLLLSGVGDAEKLKALGICPVQDLKGVGQNLHDHVGFSVQVACPAPITQYRYFSNPLAMIEAAGAYLIKRRGPLAESVTEAIAFLRSGAPGTDELDLKFILVLLMVEGNAGMLLKEHGVMNRIVLTRPESRGELVLRSADPLAPLAINPNYLAEPRDREAARRAVKIAREVFDQKAYSRFRGRERYPGPQCTTDAQIDAYLRQTVQVNNEAVGTCKMGRDTQAVVDETLKVHGMEGLRIVDASIMPRACTGDPNATVIMIAEKAAELIISSRD
jgi:choline dehydrogenase